MPNLRPPMKVSYGMSSQSGESNLSSSQMSIDSSFHPSQHSGTSDSRGSIIEDKAETSTNPMAVTFFTILCEIERNHPPGKESHIFFTYLVFRTSVNNLGLSVTECSSKSRVQSSRALTMACFNWRQGINDPRRNIPEIQACPWHLSRYIHSLRIYSALILHSASAKRGGDQTWYSLRNLERSLQLPTIVSTQERGMTRIDRYPET
jgi:hypothetical protein